VLPEAGAQPDADGVLALVASRRDAAVLAPAAWFPVLTAGGRVRPVPTADGPVLVFPPAAPAATGWGERLLAGLLLLGLSPVLLVSALIIRLADGGPAFFVQERFGRDGRPFRLCKLRTMGPGAEGRRKILASTAPPNRPFKIEDDPRATRFGCWLRRHGLDELPQLVHVLNGQMRLIGPRPLPDYENPHYTRDWHRARLDGMPGLTGLWQVSGRNRLSFDEMCQLDIWYLRNRTPWLDLRIAAATLREILRG